MNLTRANLRALAELRLKDASILLKNGAYSSAYYLAGYSVELGLKACVARQFRQDEIPDKQLINNVLSHDFTRLIGIAGLKTELARTQDEDQTFQSYWGIVGEWSSESRYFINPV